MGASSAASFVSFDAMFDETDAAAGRTQMSQQRCVPRGWWWCNCEVACARALVAVGQRRGAWLSAGREGAISDKESSPAKIWRGCLRHASVVPPKIYMARIPLVHAGAVLHRARRQGPEGFLCLSITSSDSTSIQQCRAQDERPRRPFRITRLTLRAPCSPTTPTAISTSTTPIPRPPRAPRSTMRPPPTSTLATS